MESILLTRAQAEEAERRELAPFALRSADSRGRRYAEANDSHRTAFARDRDRVVHCGAFRRLEYKTQVVISGMGDNYRTRLTHTLEVSQIARSLCQVLRLNLHLVEALALVHDLGHPPFGHSGEEELRSLMQDHGGFEHNVQALRIVDLLETPYPTGAGLNLCHETRESILKHGAGPAGELGREFPTYPQHWLEAQLVDLADSLAYYAHDLDDGLRFGVFKPADLDELELWQRAHEQAQRSYPDASEDDLVRPTLQQMLKLPIHDLHGESEQRLRESGVTSALEARTQPRRLIAFSEAMTAMQRELRRFLFARFYRAEQVVVGRTRGRRQLRNLFEYHLDHPATMPGWAHRRLEGGLEPGGLPRVVCDYIAGMTDRFAMSEHQRLIDAGPGEDQRG